MVAALERLAAGPLNSPALSRDWPLPT
jgi:hypothetical protein